MPHFVELRGPTSIFRSDTKRCLQGKYLGYEILTLNISDTDEKILKNQNDFKNVICNLSEDLQTKLKTNVPKIFVPPENHFKNNSYYLENPTPIINPWIYRSI